jgi:hypothetical protein
MSEVCADSCPVAQSCQFILDGVAASQRRLLRDQRIHEQYGPDYASDDSTPHQTSPGIQETNRQLAAHEQVVSQAAEIGMRFYEAEAVCRGPGVSMMGKILMLGSGLRQHVPMTARERAYYEEQYKTCNSPAVKEALIYLPKL